MWQLSTLTLPVPAVSLSWTSLSVPGKTVPIPPRWTHSSEGSCPCRVILTPLCGNLSLQWFLLQASSSNPANYWWLCHVVEAAMTQSPFPMAMPNPVSFLSLWDIWHYPPPGHGFFYTFLLLVTPTTPVSAFPFFYYQWPIKWSISSPFKILWLLLENPINSSLSPPLHHPFVLKIIIIIYVYIVCTYKYKLHSGG